MKKLVLVIALALAASFGAKAQFYVGGAIHFGTDQAVNENGDDTVGLDIAPEFGYFLNDNMAIGASIGYTNMGFGGGNMFTIAPYFRYFLLEMGPVNLFLDGQLEVLIFSGGGATQTGFGVGVAPGISIPVSDQLSFVGHLGHIGYYGGSFEIDASPANIAMGLYYSF